MDGSLCHTLTVGGVEFLCHDLRVLLVVGQQRHHRLDVIVVLAVEPGVRQRELCRLSHGRAVILQAKPEAGSEVCRELIAHSNPSACQELRVLPVIHRCVRELELSEHFPRCLAHLG